MAGSEATKCNSNAPTKSAVRRFIGVRQRPSGRWVAEIKDSSQRMRLWLGTFDSPEEAARAYDEAAWALRGDNARTNFAPLQPPNSSPLPDSPSSHLVLGSLSPERDAGRRLNFASLKAKLSKNLQSIMARSTNNKAPKSRVSDHFTFASIFHRRTYTHPAAIMDKKNIEKTVQPSFIVPHTNDDQSSWESTTSGSESGYFEACESIGFSPPWWIDSDGSDVGDPDTFLGGTLLVDNDQVTRWMGTTPQVIDRENETSRSKRFKVSSSIVIPPSFSTATEVPLDSSH